MFPSNFKIDLSDDPALEHHVPALDQWTYSVSPGETHESIVFDPSFRYGGWNFAGIKYDEWYLSAPLRGFPVGSTAYWRISINFWLVFAVSVVPLALFATIRLLRRRPRKTAACAKCAYDLRAHHVGERCPECGTAIPETFTKR